MNNQNQGGQADNSNAPLQSAIPNVLMTNANDENQSIRVESVILEADQHNWVANNFGKTAFVLPKKASVLSNDSLLVWRTIWSQYAIGQNKSVSFPRESGGVLLIKRCRLFVDGKLLSSNEEVGKYIMLKNKFLPYDAQNEILDTMIGSNHDYCYDVDGVIQLSEDKRMGERGVRELTNNQNATYECAVPLSQLFKLLGDTLLPMSLRGEIRVEIEWEGQYDQVICEGGTGFGGADRVGIEVVRPRLHLDYIQYAPEVEEALKQQITSSEGMTIAYREPVLVKKSLPAIPAGANNQAQDDLELGFMGRSVMKIYAQKLATASNAGAVLTREGRSDGLTGEEVQLVVNNKTMFDRPVSKVSEMYSYLNQTGEMPFNTLPATYGLVGVYNTADANVYADNVRLPSNIARPTAMTNVAGVRTNYQGRQRWLGFNLASQRLGADTPSNSMKIGEAPIILRINRKNTGNSDETSNDARTRSAVNVNIWVECVNALVMKNGRVEVLEL
jgi:hypothetical protein